MTLRKENWIAMGLAILFWIALVPMTFAQNVTLPQSSDDPVVLHVSNGAADSEMLQIRLRGAASPIAGRVSVKEQLVTFSSAFGFEPGQDYVAHVILGDDTTQIPFKIAAKTAAVPAAVTGIFPSGPFVPENTLRFYIHFSVPMQPQVAFDYISLRDEIGTVDKAAFMRFKQELWNEDRTRLTVLFDPGRIKRAVATNVELGPALQSGQHYTLSVENGWPSADGSTVLPAFSKAFRVTGALRTRPDTRHWVIDAPCVGTRAPLIVTFDRPFDRHGLSQTMRLETDGGDVIDGAAKVTHAEQAWSFVPRAAWRAQTLRLRVDPTLEDVAGNNFHDLLDHVAGQDDDPSTNSELMIHLATCAD